MNKLRIGVIGAGRIGRTHAVSIATRVPGAELAAVADIDPQAAQELGDQFHVPLVTADYGRILEDADIDAVAICSSTDTHTQIIRDAAAAGKPIFCEKPIDHSLDKIDSALAAVEEAGVKFQVGFNRRFDANFRKVRELVAGGEIGQPHILRITSRDPEPPPIEYIKVSGGIFLDMTIHDFDMARYLIDSEVEEIYVAGGVRVDPAIGEAGDIDTTIVTLKFADGTIGAIDNSRKAIYGYDQRVEVFGSKGMAAISNNTPDRHVLSNARGIHSALPLHFFFERYMDSFVAEMEAFVTCVLEDTEPPVTGLDGRAPVVIGLAAWKSYSEGRPVKLSEIG
jgi:myo-inositol 2-dehydrogenase/D-chiro-inositol 1-dehydrogenase